MYPEDSLQLVLGRQAAVRRRARDAALVNASRPRRFGRSLRLVDAAADMSVTRPTYVPSSDGPFVA